MSYLRGKKKFSPPVKEPVELIQDCDKYLNSSKTKVKHLDFFSPEQMLLSIVPLKFMPPSFLKTEDDPALEGGFLLFFMINNEGIEKNPTYLKYQRSDLEFKQVFLAGDPVMRIFFKEIPRPTDGLELVRVVMDLLSKIYSPKIMKYFDCEISSEEAPMEYFA